MVTLCLWATPVSATPESDAATLATSINSYYGETTGNLTASASGATVTVTGTVTLNNSFFPELDIKDDVTLDWKASLTTNDTSKYNEFRPYGNGTFRLLSGGSLTYAGPSDYTVGALNPRCRTTVIDGGTISCSTAAAIRMSGNYGDRTVTVKSGMVTGNHDGAIYVATAATDTTVINMEGGTLNYSDGSIIAKGVIYAFRGIINTVITGGTIQDPNNDANCSVWYNNYQNQYIASGNILHLNGTADGSNPLTIGGNSGQANLYYIGTVKTPATYGLKANQKIDLSVMELQKTVDNSAYTYNAATPYGGTVCAIFNEKLNLASASVAATAGTVAANHQYISFSGTLKNDAITATVAGAKFGDTALPTFTTTVFGINIIPPSYDINITGGTADPSSATAGETVTVIANTAPSGQRFKEWSFSPSVSFVDGTSASSATAKFTMPAAAVTATAVYEVIPAHQGYINGYQNGTFRPNAAITRAEAAQLLYNLTGATIAGTASFGDVPIGEWYEKAVTYLAERGVINGYQDGTFKPGNSITRAEFTTLIVRYQNITAAGKPSFNDISANHWAKSYIGAAQNAGLIGGYQDGSFQPEHKITRAETVTILNRALKRSDDSADYTGLTMPFSDVPANHWAYREIIEAAVTHNVTIHK